MVFLIDLENIVYFLGYYSEFYECVFGLVVFLDSELFLFMFVFEVEDVCGGDWIYFVYGYNDIENFFIIIVDEIKKCVVNLSKFVIEKKYMSVDCYE